MQIVPALPQTLCCSPLERPISGHTGVSHPTAQHVSARRPVHIIGDSHFPFGSGFSRDYAPIARGVPHTAVAPRDAAVAKTMACCAVSGHGGAGACILVFGVQVVRMRRPRPLSLCRYRTPTWTCIRRVAFVIRYKYTYYKNKNTLQL